LILVSQESTAYGRDLRGKPRLIPLLERLCALGDGFWLRIQYMHPARLDTELIEYIIDNRAICNYFDVPLQHISDDILRAMDRQVNRRRIEEIVKTIRNAGDRSAIRTNFIVGFPGETEAHFEELYRFVEGVRFDRLGAFEYSLEENTKAAGYEKQVDGETRSRRYHRLMERQRQIAFERNEEEIGRVRDIIVDSIDEDSGEVWGRTRFDSPEIDQAVRLTADGTKPGDIVTAVITECDGYDLKGERAEA
jgi:ribosomal protein S12 methylthiotransferase